MGREIMRLRQPAGGTVLILETTDLILIKVLMPGRR